MANDATNKTAPNSDSTETSSLATTGDQQKVPPLRIVLNSTSNQKTSSNTVANQQTSSRKDKSQDGRAEGAIKSGRVRIKLGTNKQLHTGKANDPSQTPNKRNTESVVAKSKDKNNAGPNDKQEENINEDQTSNFGHLRRITRRSQRTIQSISNEDEESISSMTSVDENLNANTTQANSDTTQDPEQSNPTSSTTGSAAACNNATNGSSNTDTPRRYKRRKLESSESQSFECDSLLGAQSYKLPHQNSFELFKNIRKQVDKRLKSLNCVQPKTPFGLRDYMLTRGAYLLDGNKLGNGTNLFMNEDGGLNTAPLGKYHVIRSSRTHYSVPSKARVPTEIPADSPLHDLFIEQERERHRMRIQHIKEREKLTLAAEQELLRAYGQAALVAANQDEPFSVCTLLKHQEIYNYLDSDGVTILSREDAQQDQINQPEGVRTRRRHHEQISPGPVRKGSGADESISDSSKKAIDTPSSGSGDKKVEFSATSVGEKIPEEADTNKIKSQESKHDEDKLATITEVLPAQSELVPPKVEPSNSELKKNERDESVESTNTMAEPVEKNLSSKDQTEVGEESMSCDSEDPRPKSRQSDPQDATNPDNSTSKMDAADDQGEPVSQPMSVDSNRVISDEERRTANRDIFLAQLQEIDDKWDKIRRDMLVRHRNEAESLHAIQKLEWEWKTKETGVCDVRTTLIIDNTFVPKLDILSQDY